MKFPGLGEGTYMFTLGLYTYVYYITIKSLFKNSKVQFHKVNKAVVQFISESKPSENIDINILKINKEKLFMDLSLQACCPGQLEFSSQSHQTINTTCLSFLNWNIYILIIVPISKSCLKE